MTMHGFIAGLFGWRTRSWMVVALNILVCTVICVTGGFAQNSDSSRNAVGDLEIKPREHSFFYVSMYESAFKELQQTITLNVTERSRIDVLKNIARQGNLGIALDEDHVNLNTMITLSLENVTIAEGLYHALAGTGLEAAITRRREIVLLEKDPPAEEKTVSSRKTEETVYGIIFGEIVDALTGETLPGATVVIDGTRIGVSTDIDGRFVLRRVPAGEHIVMISYMGYETKRIPVAVTEDGRTELNVKLQDIPLRGEDIIIVATQRGQARALTRQRQSINIRNIISSEQIDNFADENVEGALKRVVGMGHGGTNIRGVGAGASNITIDGQRMGSTQQNRSVDLSTISADMVQELDVIKVITPNMDADAMSGTINVSTRRPIGGDRSMNVRLGSGLQSRYYAHSGASTRLSFSFGDSPSRNISYGVNFDYQRSPRATEEVSTEWGGRTWDDVGRVDVVSDFRSQVRFDVRDRYSAGFQITFQPTERSTYHLQSMFNRQLRTENYHSKRYEILLNRYTNQTQTGPWPGNQSKIEYNPRLDEPVTNQYSFQVGGRHRMDRFDMEYTAGWGHGRLTTDSYRYRIRTEGRFDYFVNLDDRLNVRIDVAPHGVWNTYPGPGRLQFDQLDHRINRHVDNEFTTRLNFDRPYQRGTIKFGSSALMSFSSGEGERFSSLFTQRLNANEFEWIPNATWNVLGRTHQSYTFDWMLDLEKAKRLYIGQKPYFDYDQAVWAQELGISQYKANEHTIATYLMGDMTLGRLVLLGGARVEHSINYYTGQEASISRTGDFRGSSEVKSVNHFTNLFPNAQLVYTLTNRTNVRFAYSRTIGRPTFRQLSPNVLRNYSSETIVQGNPDLKPMLSHNLDFIIDHYFMQVGQISLGLFYKDLSDFVYSLTDFIRSDVDDDTGDNENIYDGWRRTTFANGEEAKVYGLEFSWQQTLLFLPGFLSNINLYANYAYTQSLADIGRYRLEPNRTHEKQLVHLIDMRPHVVNVGVGYNQGPFSSQISYHWASPSIISYQEPQWVPQIHQRHREHFDFYRDAANDMSLILRYRISGNFRVWMDASNLLNHRQIDYNFDRDYYPRTISLSGRRMSLGLRYTF
jgi:TonB-dependent receptor